MLAIERRLRERVRALAKPALAGPVRPPDSFYDWALRYLPHHFNLKSSLFHQWLAEELAEFIPGVTDVKNELQIRPAPPEGQARRLEQTPQT